MQILNFFFSFCFFFLSCSVCPGNCEFCTANKVCCDKNCVYCDDKKPSKCLTCLVYGIGEYNDRQCVDKCPANTYKYENRRCLNEAECRNLSAPVKADSISNLPVKPFMPFEDQCISDCPPNFNVIEHHITKQRTCEACSSGCQRNCSGGSIMSAADASKYKGCTRVTGSMVFQLQRQGGREFDFV